VKLVLKGILTPEDEKQAAESGIDRIVVSNHGGRVEDGVGAITVLPEIVEAVGGRVPLAGKITKAMVWGCSVTSWWAALVPCSPVGCCR
jgi:hypothetical protein